VISRCCLSLIICTGGEYRRVRHDRHFSDASSFQIGCRAGFHRTPVCRKPVTIYAPFRCKDRHAQPPILVPMVTLRASMILGAFEQAQTELVGKAVILTDGKAGTVENIWLDELHGLRISIRGHDGKWPISTIKFAQTG
jgi:hypothetical protein